MGEQLALLPPDPAPTCDRTLADLVRAMDPAAPRVPLWAVLAGEAWFRRAYRTARPRWVLRFGYTAFGIDVLGEEPEERYHFECQDAFDEEPGSRLCLACERELYAPLGDVTLALAIAATEARRGK